MATSHSLRLSSISFTRKPSTGSSCRLLYSWARALWALVDRFWLLAINNVRPFWGYAPRNTVDGAFVVAAVKPAVRVVYLLRVPPPPPSRGLECPWRVGQLLGTMTRSRPTRRTRIYTTNEHDEIAANDEIRDDVAADSRQMRTAHYRLHVNNNCFRESRGANRVQN